MSFWDRWQEVFLSLSRRRLRTALTALSVAWGILMLVVLLAAGRGLANGTERSFQDNASNSVFVRPGNTRIPYRGQPQGRRIEFENADLGLIQNKDAGYEHHSGRFYPRADTHAAFRDKEGHYQVRSVHPGHLFIEKTTIETGRYINERDIRERRKVAVIGQAVADNLFRGEPTPLGRFIKLGSTEFLVVGTFSDAGDDREQETIYVPFSTGQLSFAGNNHVDAMMFTINPLFEAEAPAIIEDLRSSMAKRHGFSPKDTMAVRMRNQNDFAKKLESVLWAIRAFVWIIGLGTILAGVVGVGNIMLIAVRERTREFGIRKALGASPLSIVSMIMEEALAITILSGYLGLVAGVALVQAAAKFIPNSDFFRNPEVDVSVGFAATGVLVVAGVLAGFIPAWRAARVAPIEALRAEI